MNETASYTIKRGDSIYNLARAYNTTISAILDANPDLSPYNLKIGNVIIIPVNYRNNSELEGMKQPLQLTPMQQREPRSQPMPWPQMPRQQNRPRQPEFPQLQLEVEPDFGYGYPEQQPGRDDSIDFDIMPRQQNDYIDYDNRSSEQKLHREPKEEVKTRFENNSHTPAPFSQRSEEINFDNMPKIPNVTGIDNRPTKQKLIPEQSVRDESIDFDNTLQELQPAPQQEEKISSDNTPGQFNGGMDFDNITEPQTHEMPIEVPDITPHTREEQALPDSNKVLPPVMPVQKRQFKLFSDRPDNMLPAGSMRDLDRGMDRAITDLSKWSRFFLVSMLSDIDDGDETAARLIRVAADIGNKFGMFYPRSVSTRIEELFNEFIMAQVRLLDAYHNGSQDMPALNTAWTGSAHKLAESLSGINPNYSYDMLNDYLNKFVDDSKRLWVLRMGGEYADEIGVYDRITSNLTDFAQYLSDGITKQFPNRFKAEE